ncbi:hypothetical protein [Megalodesulfovibrio gigas]|uniref:Uncharacterized protein n=1 Tax=Megalodesulfovibrio gigas (strain ATCC 19364 / DSM 1382 / NCIMB 9332 / VKM B-1759) TaxID=1121448 RepID=T2GDA0_MEGG1|nr:hypothetical protein [Megalodesulfovibrio gigas]AGW14081.1 hypothetical protein DGI_2328 [Megalodesulfovibrio gigas DSM 1382 = ATCC 19364]
MTDTRRLSPTDDDFEIEPAMDDSPGDAPHGGPSLSREEARAFVKSMNTLFAEGDSAEGGQA